MNKELEEAINRLKQDYELAKSEDSIDIDVFTADLETILNYIENSISKEVIEETLNYDKSNYINYIKADSKRKAIQDYIEYLKKELLEGK